MSNIFYRSGAAGSTPGSANATNGSVARPLTNLEIDKNFWALDNDKFDKSGGTITGATTFNSNVTIKNILLPGATSGTITLAPIAVAGTTTITFPATTGTVVTTGDTGSVTSAMILDGTIVNADIATGAAIAIAKLAASTISGVSLGNNLNALTIGTGLSGTSFNGSSAVTIAIDNTVALKSEIKDGTLTVANPSAGLTNTAVSLKLSGAYSANAADNRTIEAVVGPAITNLTTLMATAGAGFIKRGAAADTYTIDTNTYLTGNQSITLSGDVTGTGTTAITTTIAAGAATIAKGGVGFTTYAAGDIIYASAANTLAKLAKGSDGQVLKLVSGLPTWAADNDTDTIYSLPLATNGARGGVQIGYGTNGKNYAVELASEKMYVNVPWTDTVYSLPIASATVLGGIKVGTRLSIDANGVLSADSQSFTLNAATSAALGGVKLFSDTTQSIAANSVSTTASRTYGIQVNGSGQLVVNVPWTDTDTNTDTLQSISDDTANADRFVTFVSSATGAQTAQSNSAFKFNPSTGTLSSTIFNSTSDINFKKDLEKIDNALDKVKSLTGYTFTMIESNQRSTGLIAQDVKEVLPEAVIQAEDRMTLAYGNMMGLIVEAIKELETQVRDIKNMISNK